MEGKVRDEYIVIGSWPPVQFLTPNDDLERKAVMNALPTEVDGVRTGVMPAADTWSPSHAKTGRAKVTTAESCNSWSKAQWTSKSRCLSWVNMAWMEKWKQFEIKFFGGPK